jgi:hypothetical protein
MVDRFTRGMNELLPRKKGKRLGSLWFSKEGGDVTFDVNIDDDIQRKVDLLNDWLTLLQAEYIIAVLELEQEVGVTEEDIEFCPDEDIFEEYLADNVVQFPTKRNS